MLEVLLIEKPDQAEAILHPLRLEILKRSGEPRTCTELADAVGETPQKIYYHVKVLQRAGVLERVEERRVRAIHEGYYQAVARAYWLSPKLVGRVPGPRRPRDPASLGSLLPVVEELQSDVGRLAERERPGSTSLAFSAQVRLARPEDRTAFLSEVQNAIQAVAKKYGAAGPGRPTSRESEPDTFRLVFACYTKPEERGA
ncbi:MAG TPA: helix-turn-helix domain-containing protein [Candidatus Polarisedimenticolia bacterium]|nr:helix-turn-helix domain-containing protein [Candidatus Polarisedimenticolia bacterium]